MKRAVATFVGVVSVLAGPVVVNAQTINVQTERSADTVTTTLRADGLTMKQSVTPAAFRLRLAAGADVVELAGDEGGAVEVRRGRQVVRYSMMRVTAGDFTRVARLVGGSRALARFAGLRDRLGAVDARTRAIVETAAATVALLQGDRQPLLRIAARIRASAPGVVTVAQRTRQDPTGPGDCWAQYERTVLRYTYELEACMREASESLNPLRSFGCAYEYDLKTTLAFFWLLDCSGFPF